MTNDFPKSTSSHVSEAAAVAALFTLLAIAATYPLIRTLTTSLASDLGDPLLVTWILGWDAERIRHGLHGIWNAPNFFPYRYTLLYSEHFLGVAIFTAPLQWLSRNPVLVYNLTFLASFVVSGCGMYALAKYLIDRRDAALIAAFTFAFYPFRASHASHLQLLMIGWLPLCLCATHRYFETRRARDLMAATIFYLLQALTCGYFAYFTLIPLAIIGGSEIWRTRAITRRFCTHLVVAGAVATAVMLPVVRAYWTLREESGLRRPLDEIASQGADIADYLNASSSLYLWGGLGRHEGEHELFPGLTVVILSIAAVRYRRRPVITLYAGVLAAAFLLSLGPHPRVWGRDVGVPGPYAFWLRVMPGLDGIRVPARFAIVGQVALGVLAAAGASWVLDRIDRGSEPRRLAATGIALAVIAAEGWARLGTPSFDHRGDARAREAYQYLRGLPKGAAIELPTRAEDVLREFQYQYMTLSHGHPVVNGHSGYVTPLAAWLRGGHSPLREPGRQRDAVEMIRSLGVRYLVIHRDFYDDPGLLAELLEVVERDPGVIERRTFETITVAVLAPTTSEANDGSLIAVAPVAMSVSASTAQDRVPLMLDGDRDTRWLSMRPQAGDESVTVNFDRMHDIAVVRLQLGARSFGDYPRTLEIDSLDGTVSRTLFRGSILPQFARGLLHGDDYPFIDVHVPSNHTTTLVLRQVGTAHTFFWSIHELRILERS